MGIAPILASAVLIDGFLALTALPYQAAFTELRLGVTLDGMGALGFIDTDRPARLEPLDMASLNAGHQEHDGLPMVTSRRLSALYRKTLRIKILMVYRELDCKKVWVCCCLLKTASNKIRQMPIRPLFF